MLKYIDRNDEELNKIGGIWEMIADTEAHHDHKIVKENDTYYWETTFTGTYDLNQKFMEWEKQGLNKNSEEVRAFLRSIGYSLFGYWEILYWEVNNELAKDYIPLKV